MKWKGKYFFEQDGEQRGGWISFPIKEYNFYDNEILLNTTFLLHIVNRQGKKKFERDDVYPWVTIAVCVGT